MSSLSTHIPGYMRPWRSLKNSLATFTVTVGGMGVLVAILLIFFYLLYEIVPLFNSAEIERAHEYSLPETADNSLSKPVFLAMEEQAEVAFRIDSEGRAQFFEVATGQLRLTEQLAGRPTAVASDTAQSRILAVAYGSGEISLIKHHYRISYPQDKRLISPELQQLYPELSIRLQTQGRAVDYLAVREGEEALVIAGVFSRSSLTVSRFVKEVDFLSDEVSLEEQVLNIPASAKPIATIYIDPDQRWLFQLNRDGSYLVWDLAETSIDGYQALVTEGRFFDTEARYQSSTLLLGGLSLLVASDQGELAQYFMVNQQGDYHLEKIRNFEIAETASALITEQRRKGFLSIDQSGVLNIHHSTSQRLLLTEKISDQSPTAYAISPRADSLLIEREDGLINHWRLHNEYPEVSWSALWSKVWYESYSEPEYIWQSSSSSNDFEPKYSFTPLAFGTLKAAFYAMLFAAPLAICGAIYTAYFMAPAMRKKVKPLVELMEALPTVILGFLAGLWLAPFVEGHLTGVFAVLFVLPVGVLAFAFGWSQMPALWRSRIPPGWQAAILVPVVGLLFYFSFSISDVLEIAFFKGDMRAWLTRDLGVSFDQRNALVVGIAMGIAVIPTIFSIAEDAIFSVPRHLSYGSLALGATPWQTMVGVVLPTASPGIFSGLMIGMGRAVGETMIVLMATGNTPIMDANIFEGMRTLAANIAVEVPEAEVGSSHYRVLFLAAFVLFMFTFIVNTVAEIVRQRLRKRYGTL